ncbi:hypothetical protein CEXT_509151 [Caerostris extrusa]|uniref:Uncharacterized protein n=1 Tax=Caerostris extrusa TaxID=172846 RepID=A0AAV4Q4Y8_CAEEX|nr:hypothetical protein CEXT_509151 [Caerostris extrusa]
MNMITPLVEFISNPKVVAKELGGTIHTIVRFFGGNLLAWTWGSTRFFLPLVRQPFGLYQSLQYHGLVIVLLEIWIFATTSTTKCCIF